MAEEIVEPDLFDDPFDAPVFPCRSNRDIRPGPRKSHPQHRQRRQTRQLPAAVRTTKTVAPSDMEMARITEDLHLLIGRTIELINL